MVLLILCRWLVTCAVRVFVHREEELTRRSPVVVVVVPVMMLVTSCTDGRRRRHSNRELFRIAVSHGRPVQTT